MNEQQPDIKITDTSTTMNKRSRTYSPEALEVRTTTIQPGEVSVAVDTLEIITLPPDGECKVTRYKILVDGKEVMARRVSFVVGVDEPATAELVWFPWKSEWGK